MARVGSQPLLACTVHRPGRRTQANRRARTQRSRWQRASPARRPRWRRASPPSQDKRQANQNGDGNNKTQSNHSRPPPLSHGRARAPYMKISACPFVSPCWTDQTTKLNAKQRALMPEQEATKRIKRHHHGSPAPVARRDRGRVAGVGPGALAIVTGLESPLTGPARVGQSATAPAANPLSAGSARVAARPRRDSQPSRDHAQGKSEQGRHEQNPNKRIASLARNPLAAPTPQI